MSGAPTQLHLQLAQRILLHARVSGLTAGHHVTETSLQELFGTSRGPIRAALMHLAEKGFLEKKPNKGFFLTQLPGNGADAVDVLPEGEDERAYLTIAADRLDGKLPETVTENELMRRYGLPRYRLHRLLRRITAEGWIERKSGHGWSFLPMIDSVRSYSESYELRRMLEPSGLLSAFFEVNRPALAQLREQQQFIQTSGHLTLGQIELFETNAHFHETIAEMSGNRFLVQTIARQNQLRRLVEYRQTVDRNRVRRQASEHLAILDALQLPDPQLAASLLERHIGNARKEKARSELFAPRDQ